MENSRVKSQDNNENSEIKRDLGTILSMTCKACLTTLNNGLTQTISNLTNSKSLPCKTFGHRNYQSVTGPWTFKYTKSLEDHETPLALETLIITIAIILMIIMTIITIIMIIEIEILIIKMKIMTIITIQIILYVWR